MLNDDILCFGLLQSSVSFLEVGCGRSFHFLHLTFQEYLAALFLVKQESDSQVADSVSLSSIKRLTDQFPVEDHHSIVSRFFFGIAFSFEMFCCSVGQRILTMFPNALYSYYTNRVLSHFLWAFEAQNKDFAHIIAGYCKRFSLNPSTAHEVMAIAYVISITADLECNGVVIDFGLCGLHDYHIKALTDALASKDGMMQMKYLNLFGNKLTGRGVTDLFSRASAAFQSLECLNLGGNRIRSDGINSALTTLAKSCHKVKFYFYDNPFEVSSLNTFGEGLCHHQPNNLLVLHLEGSLSSDADTNAKFILALENCTNLKVLDLSRNSLHVPGGRALGKILPKLSLDELKVSETVLGDEGMVALVQSLEGECDIKELDLGSNNIHAAGISYLAKSIYTENIFIEDVLCLDDNSLCWEGAIDLLKLLFTRSLQIRHLSVQRCKLTTIRDINDKCISYSGMRELLHGLMNKANSIEEIYLSDNFTEERIHLLAGLMCLCPHLKILATNNCLITSDDLKQLLSLLSQLKFNHLKTWNLSQNNIDDAGATALIEHSPIFPSLIHIEVDNDQISPEVCRSLEESYKRRRKV